MTTLPTADDLAAYMGVDEATPGLQTAVTVALAQQAARCDVSDYTEPLREAALRRAAGNMAARSAPLGLVDLGELGPTRIPGWDGKTEELEAPYRYGPLA